MDKLVLGYIHFITGRHQDLSQPVKASFSQKEDVLYRSHLTNSLVAYILIENTIVNVSFQHESISIKAVQMSAPCISPKLHTKCIPPLYM